MCRRDYNTIEQQAEDAGQHLLCPICRIENARTAKEDFDRALARSKEDRGWAIEKVGIMYNFGDGVKEDKKKAAEFYKRAADKGLPLSCNNLGNKYY